MLNFRLSDRGGGGHRRENGWVNKILGGQKVKLMKNKTPQGLD